MPWQPLQKHQLNNQPASCHPQDACLLPLCARCRPAPFAAGWVDNRTDVAMKLSQILQVPGTGAAETQQAG